MAACYAEEEDSTKSLMHAPYIARQVAINSQREVQREFANN